MANLSTALTVPLAAGFLYAMAAIVLKRASGGGVGPWRIAFVANWTTALVFAPMWLLGGAPFTWLNLAHAAICATAFFVGQVFTFLALSRGDVSVATPVLGLKVILVAAFTTLLLGQGIPGDWWLAGGLIALATALLGGGGSRAGEARWLPSLGYGLGAAAAFALTDVLMQKWAAAWGFGHFAPALFAIVALLSFALIPFFHEPLRALPKENWRWLIAGSLLLSAQASCIAWSIVSLGGATVVNILYSSRGIWSVLIVWTIGPLFGNIERDIGTAVMSRRLLGAGLLLGAIVLVVL